MIRSAMLDDAARLAEIYNYYIEKTTVTFEEEALDASEMRARISCNDDTYPWLVADADGTACGYAYAAPWSDRMGYRPSAETTVYLAQEYVGKGLGIDLYGELIESLRRKKLHSAIGVIALPNAASIALHERLGFKKIGEFQEIGRKFGQWINVGYWQLLL